MSFLAPLVLAAAGLAVLPLVAHMLRRARSNTIEFPSLRFLRETPSFARALTRPNRPWLLALRMLIVAAIALAFARPVIHVAAVSAGEDVVVLLDRSASMARADAREAAVAAATARIRQLAPRDRVRVGAFDTRVVWLGEPEPPERALGQLDGYRPGFAEADLAAALAAANEALGAMPAAPDRIVVVSDFQRANGPWSADTARPSAAVEMVRVGDDFANSFVAGVAPVDATTVRCGVVRSDAATRRVSTVSLQLAGAGASGCQLERAGPGYKVTTTDADGLDADDARFFADAPDRRVFVCDTPDGRPYLSAAVSTLVASSVDSAADLSSGIPERANVALVGTRAIGDDRALEQLRAWAEAGGAAVVFADRPVGGPLPAVTGEPHAADGLVLAGDARLSEDSELSGALAASPLRAVRGVNAVAGDTVVATTLEGEPVAVRRPIGDGWVTVVGFGADPDSTPIVRAWTFGAFVEALVGTDAGAAAGAAGRRTKGLGSATHVTAPDGSALAVDADGSFVPEAPGFYTVAAGGRSRVVPVNVALAESETARLAPDEVAALARDAHSAGTDTSGAVVASLDASQGLWRIVLALALALSILELAVASRRFGAQPLAADEPATGLA